MGSLRASLIPAHDPTVYFVQIAGNFSYTGGPCCSRHVWHARAISMILNARTLVAVEGGFDTRTADVKLMGTAYQLPPPTEHLVPASGPVGVP